MSSRWNMLWALTWMLITWLLVEVLVFLPLYLLGLAAFPIAWKWAPLVPDDSRVWDDGRVIVAFQWRWLDEWLGNHEDGLLPQQWVDQSGTAYSWFIRNPISNLRFWPVVSLKSDQARVRFCGNVAEILETPGWFVCWQGAYVGLRWIWSKPILKTKGIAIGWHLNPRDRNGIPVDDARRFGIGTVCQRLKYEGGA